MRRVIINDTSTVRYDECNVGRLIAIHSNKVGVVQFYKEEGLFMYRIVWSDGIITQGFNGIASFAKNSINNGIEIFEV